MRACTFSLCRYFRLYYTVCSNPSTSIVYHYYTLHATQFWNITVPHLLRWWTETDDQKLTDVWMHSAHHCITLHHTAASTLHSGIQRPFDAAVCTDIARVKCDMWQPADNQCPLQNIGVLSNHINMWHCIHWTPVGGTQWSSCDPVLCFVTVARSVETLESENMCEDWIQTTWRH